MIVRILAAALALSPAFAADKPAKRTIGELRTLVLEKGEVGKLGKPTAKDLGFSDKPVQIKQLWFDQGVVSDGQEHVFAAVVNAGTKGNMVWSVSRSTTTPTGDAVSGYNFLVSSAGDLLAAAQANGIVGHVKRQRLTPAQARRVFEREKTFWIQDSAKYTWSK